MTNLGQPLTPAQARRIRLQLALIPLYVWIAFTWAGYFQSVAAPGPLDDGGQLKGHDFAHFYVLGQLALERRPLDLYSYDAQAARTDALAGHWHRYLPTYGPQVSMLFAPLALLPYLTAWKVWTFLSATLYGVSCYALWRSETVLRPYAWPTFIAAVAYPPFAMLIDFGHITALVLAAFTIAYLALRSRRAWLAGFALGCLFIKPPLGLMLPFILLRRRDRRLLVGAAAAVLIQLVGPWAYYGPGALAAYLRTVIHFGQVAAELEPQLYRMQSLRSFFSVLLPWPNGALVCYAIAACLVVVVAVRSWIQDTPLQVRFSVLLLATILVNPHVNVYDLVVFVPVFVLVAAWALEQGVVNWPFWALVYFCFASAPFAVQMASRTNVQFSVLGFVALFCTLAHVAKTTKPAPI